MVLDGLGEAFPDLEPEKSVQFVGHSDNLHIALDGSSTMPILSGFQRAAYAVVLFDPQAGATLSVVRGTVPG
eukprot:4658199-Pyramimonas_sp.AAC.1